MPIVKKTELADGIIAEDMKIGEGFEIPEGGAVVCHYHGTLKEGGKKFDSSYERGEPIAFPLSGVIPGWQKGVPGMKVGGIRKLTIPSAMAYGERGAGALRLRRSARSLAAALQVRAGSGGRPRAAARRRAVTTGRRTRGQGSGS
jgi:peptidylprolyl isomerase